jgi:hypothetical protein
MVCQELQIQSKATIFRGWNPPELWGSFCYPVDGFSFMKEINLIKIYQFGKEITALDRITTGEPPMETFSTLIGANRWMVSFWTETQGLPMTNTRAAMRHLRTHAQAITDRLINSIAGSEQLPITLEENVPLARLLREFELEFEHDSRELAIFGVTRKGDKDVRVLIEDASKKFPSELLAVMPDLVKEDLKQSGRCLAFDLPTACAFHVCRATEGLMRFYYKNLTGHDWPPPNITNPNWKVLVDQLAVNSAPKNITSRLGELREDRNAYAHPDVTVPLDEAPIVYEICTGSIFYIAKEMI